MKLDNPVVGGKRDFSLSVQRDGRLGITPHLQKRGESHFFIPQNWGDFPGLQEGDWIDAEVAAIRETKRNIYGGHQFVVSLKIIACKMLEKRLLAQNIAAGIATEELPILKMGEKITFEGIEIEFDPNGSYYFSWESGCGSFNSLPEVIAYVKAKRMKK